MTSEGALVYNWTVTTLYFNLGHSNVFFFWLIPGNGTSQGEETSHYFNITGGGQAASSSTFLYPSSTSTPLSTLTSSLNQTPAPNQPVPVTQSASQLLTSSSSSPVPTTSSGLEKSAKIGVGIGVGVGVPLVLLLGILVGLFIRRFLFPSQGHTKTQEGAVDDNDPPPQYAQKDGIVNANPAPTELSAQYDRPEMDIDRPRHELPTVALEP